MFSPFIVITIILVCLLPLHYCFDEELRATGELRNACSRRGAGKQPASRVQTSSKLLPLRKVMQRETILNDKKIDAYYITTDDQHQTEYVAAYDRRLQYLSGFSGSSGEAVVTLTKAALWTDGRYHLQADDQLDCNWLLMREGQSKVPTISAWLKREFNSDTGSTSNIGSKRDEIRIGADPRLISASAWSRLRRELEDSAGPKSLVLVEIHVNLIDVIWPGHSEVVSDKSAFVWDIEYAGQNWTDKVIETRKEVEKAGAEAMVVTALPEIAWLFNIRGRDIPYNFYLKSYVILTMNEIYLYTNRTKLLKNDIGKHLNAGVAVHSYSVIIRSYEEIWRDLPTLSQAWNRVLLPASCVYSKGASQAIYNLIAHGKRLAKPSPIIFLKARKNPTEISGMEQAHVRDGAAMCLFMSYFETWFQNNGNYTELDIVKEVDTFRFEQNISLGNSFPTIAAFGRNGAKPHYEPSQTTNSIIFDNSTLVIDSGGQYYDGTTDVTRTLHMGTPTVAQMNAYTRVLMGAIQLSSLVFPANMPMWAADVMARAPLWAVGLDYLHGTGHGIGAFLGVHESPISIHYNTHQTNSLTDNVFKAGYFFSNEPGFYSEGEFGVRLENILEVVSKPWLQHVSGQSFLGFKDVTLVPYEPKLINVSLLSPFHIRWLNSYNIRIREHVGRELKEQNRMDGFYWMMEKTKYIPGSSNITFSKFSLYFATLCASLLTFNNVL